MNDTGITISYNYPDETEDRRGSDRGQVMYSGHTSSARWHAGEDGPRPYYCCNHTCFPRRKTTNTCSVGSNSPPAELLQLETLVEHKSISTEITIEDGSVKNIEAPNDHHPGSAKNMPVGSSAEPKSGENVSDEIRRITESAVRALSRIVEHRDPYTAGHQQKVALLAGAVAAEMGMSEDRVDAVSTAARIHDIGKIKIPAEILTKPGKLSKIEFDTIKIHPRVGYDILKELSFPWPIAEYVLQHHERLNGSGYPSGLTSDEIAIESKIIAVADVVDSMASHRPYRPAQGIEKALEEIKRHKGKLYDPESVDACEQLLAREGFDLIKIK